MFIGNLSYVREKDCSAFIRTWKVMFNRRKLLKQKDAVGTRSLTMKSSYLGFLFTHLLPAVRFSLILCASLIVRSKILCLLKHQVPVAIKPFSKYIIDG